MEQEPRNSILAEIEGLATNNKDPKAHIALQTQSSLRSGRDVYVAVPVTVAVRFNVAQLQCLPYVPVKNMALPRHFVHLNCL